MKVYAIEKQLCNLYCDGAERDSVISKYPNSNRRCLRWLGEFIFGWRWNWTIIDSSPTTLWRRMRSGSCGEVRIVCIKIFLSKFTVVFPSLLHNNLFVECNIECLSLSCLAFSISIFHRSLKWINEVERFKISKSSIAALSIC